MCDPDPCFEGQCIEVGRNDLPGYRCLCDNGYTGQHCDAGKCPHLFNIIPVR